MNDTHVLQIPVTHEQYRIFYEAALLAGFSSEFADRDYLLYLLARDLTPVPGVFAYQKAQLCQRLMKTPTPAFWRDSDVAPSAQFAKEGDRRVVPTDVPGISQIQTVISSVDVSAQLVDNGPHNLENEISNGPERSGGAGGKSPD